MINKSVKINAFGYQESSISLKQSYAPDRRFYWTWLCLAVLMNHKTHNLGFDQWKILQPQPTRNAYNVQCSQHSIHTIVYESFLKVKFIL